MTHKILAALLILFLGVAASLQARTVQVWFDTSGSLNTDILSPAYGELSLIVTGAEGVGSIEVFGFASGVDALRMPMVTLPVPVRPKAATCDAEGEGELGIFKNQADEEKGKCAKEQDAKAAQHQSQIKALSTRLVTHLQSLERQPTSRQSCVLQAVARCLTEGPEYFCLIITDGVQEACPAPRVPPYPSGARVIVLLVPRQGDGGSASELLSARSKAIQRFAPQASVVPLFRASTELPSLIRK